MTTLFEYSADEQCNSVEIQRKISHVTATHKRWLTRLVKCWRQC